MLDPFLKSRCSFPVPDFASEAEEEAWSRSLSPAQSFELLHWMRVWRWGEEAVMRPMDRTAYQVMTMEEFTEAKQREAEEEERWRAEGKPAHDH